MGTPVRIKSDKYTFYLDGKRIYVDLNDGLKQKFVIQTYEFTELDQYSYAHLMDSIYRRKIKNTVSLNEFLMSKYRLVPTLRKL